MHSAILGAAALALLWPASGSAQNAPDANAALNFSGPSIGIQAGAVETHFYIEEALGDGIQRGRYYRSWGAGGGAFIGYDFVLDRQTVVGAEASFVLGGAENQAVLTDGSFYHAEPRVNYRFTGRVGRVVAHRTLLYLTLGYGGQHYGVASAGIIGRESAGHGFVLGGGAEHRLNRRLGLRFSFLHLDGESNQLLVGLPLRF